MCCELYEIVNGDVHDDDGEVFILLFHAYKYAQDAWAHKTPHIKHTTLLSDKTKSPTK